MLLREVVCAVIGTVAVFCFRKGILLRSGIILTVRRKTAAATPFSSFLPVSFTVSKCWACTHTHHRNTPLNISFPHYGTFLNISIQRHLLNKDTWTQLKETTGNSATWGKQSNSVKHKHSSAPYDQCMSIWKIQSFFFHFKKTFLVGWTTSSTVCSHHNHDLWFCWKQWRWWKPNIQFTMKGLFSVLTFP